jgi:hypothetical protein
VQAIYTKKIAFSKIKISLFKINIANNKETINIKKIKNNKFFILPFEIFKII